MTSAKFKLNWKVKAHTFRVLDNIPFGENLYYLLQRYVTKSIPRQLSPTKDRAAAQISHALKFRALGVDLAKANLLEFGAGWDLYSNLILYCMGVDRQCTIDVRRLVKAEAINAVIQHLQGDPPAGALRIPKRIVSEARLERDLEDYYGISYLAPFDARHLPMANDTFKLIVTTNTLEHIPGNTLHEIFTECHRVLSPQGYMSHSIDYSDHYANADPSIDHFNYLRFDDEQWRKFNPDIHFQNRFRAPFYNDLFQKCGFEIIEYIPHMGQRELLRKATLSECFSHLSFEELLELGGNYLLRKSARIGPATVS